MTNQHHGAKSVSRGNLASASHSQCITCTQKPSYTSDQIEDNKNMVHMKTFTVAMKKYNKHINLKPLTISRTLIDFRGVQLDTPHLFIILYRIFYQ